MSDQCACRIPTTRPTSDHWQCPHCGTIWFCWLSDTIDYEALERPAS